MAAIWDTIINLITAAPGFFIIIFIVLFFLLFFIGSPEVDVQRQAEFIASQIKEDINKVGDTSNVPVLIKLDEDDKLIVQMGLYKKVGKDYRLDPKGYPGVCVTSPDEKKRSCVSVGINKCPEMEVSKEPCFGKDAFAKVIGATDVVTFYGAEDGRVEIVR